MPPVGYAPVPVSLLVLLDPAVHLWQPAEEDEVVEVVVEFQPVVDDTLVQGNVDVITWTLVCTSETVWATLSVTVQVVVIVDVCVKVEVTVELAICVTSSVCFKVVVSVSVCVSTCVCHFVETSVSTLVW